MARNDKQFVRVDITNALRKFENVGKEVQLANEEMQMELARAGQEKMKEFIETGGTGFRWKRPHYAKDSEMSGSLRVGSIPGRVNTGNMRNSVSVRFEGGQKRVSAAFGWIRNFEDYFGYQDNGFYHYQADREVEGMFALRDARLYVAKELLPRLVRKYENRIARRSNK